MCNIRDWGVWRGSKYNGKKRSYVGSVDFGKFTYPFSLAVNQNGNIVPINLSYIIINPHCAVNTGRVLIK